jgi:hypothetical protein
MLNTHIYHLITSYMFRCCYTIRETIASTAQELYAFSDVVTWVVLYNMKYTLLFKIYNACYNV